MIYIINSLRDRWLPPIIIVMSILYIIAIHSTVFKLIPMVLIILFGLLQLPKVKELHHYLLVLGLLFCMLGDYSLQWFVIGLFSFLVGHVFYIFAFNLRRRKRPINKTIGIAIIVYGIIMAIIMINALIKGNESGLIFPVILYIIVISIMVWTAWLTKHIWLMVGSFCFLISDSILSLSLFVGSIQGETLLVMSTYYGAQFCFARSMR